MCAAHSGIESPERHVFSHSGERKGQCELSGRCDTLFLQAVARVLPFASRLTSLFANEHSASFSGCATVCPHRTCPFASVCELLIPSVFQVPFPPTRGARSAKLVAKSFRVGVFEASTAIVGCPKSEDASRLPLQLFPRSGLSRREPVSPSWVSFVRCLTRSAFSLSSVHNCYPDGI